jgi:hypothetical protein
MKRTLLLLVLVSAVAHAASTSKTSEVLVLASAATQLTQTTSTRGRLAIEVFNNGANTIWCAFTSATAVVTKSRPIASGSSWALDAPSNVSIWCRAATADQVTGAATVVSELFRD